MKPQIILDFGDGERLVFNITSLTQAWIIGALFWSPEGVMW
jgi:hypothetical protein